MRVLMFTVDPEKNEQDLVAKQKTLKIAQELPEGVTAIPVAKPELPIQKKAEMEGQQKSKAKHVAH